MAETRLNKDRPEIDQISLEDHESDAQGWPYALMLGGDMDRGWAIECDMQNGQACFAFTPAGVDTLFLVEAEESDPKPGSKYGRVTTVRIKAEGATAVWDPETETLTLTNRGN